MKRSRINPVSKKRQALMPMRRSLVKRLLEERMVCEARISGCTFRPTDVHEILTRGRGGSITDEDNCLVLCRNCHHWITFVSPAWAIENGFTLHAGASEADRRAASRARSAFVQGLQAEFFEDDWYEIDDD